MYELTDTTTFKLRKISPSLWKVFELTYTSLKTHAINWIEGGCRRAESHLRLILII